MAKQKQSARRFDCSQMPAAFTARQLPDTPEIRAAWQRYTLDRNQADRDTLLTFYLPTVMRCAAKLKKRKPGFYRDGIDELTSDGLVGLLKALRSFQPGGKIFYVRIITLIDQAIGYHVAIRRWGGEHRKEHTKIINRIHADLTLCLGRVPEDEEFLHALRSQITNPNFYFQGERDMVASSQLEDPGSKRELTLAVDDQDEPLEKEIDNETIDLAMKGLGAADRKLLKMILDGVPHREIAKALNLTKSAAQRRMNGLLWTLRSRRDLADYFGVEPAKMPPCRKSLLPSPAMMPPARLRATA